jgi:hypothetical protein
MRELRSKNRARRLEHLTEALLVLKQSRGSTGMLVTDIQLPGMVRKIQALIPGPQSDVYVVYFLLIFSISNYSSEGLKRFCGMRDPDSTKK